MMTKKKKKSPSKWDLPEPERPMSQLGCEGARHLSPERLPTARKERFVTMRVIDLTPETVRNIQQYGADLKRLDLSGLSLTDINDDILKDLTRLQKLDVSYNELTDEGFPSACKKLDDLMELSAHNNKIGKLPKVLRKLKNLTRLKLGHNTINTTEGVEKLKRLTILILEHNQIDSLGKDLLGNLRKLEILHCGGNKLKDVPSDIRHLKHLKDIDISDNKLIVLPRELFLLPHLQALNASGNQISRIPSTVSRRKFTKTRLTIVDLSENAIIKFPEHLLLTCNKVDLSQNKIKSIQGNIIKKLDSETEQILLIKDNPLINPPADVCECGLKAIMHFYQEGKAHMKVYQGLKLLALGPLGAGKTSLVQSLVDQQPRLTEDNERTLGVDIYDMTIELPDDGTSEEDNDQEKTTDKRDDSDSEDEPTTARPPSIKSLLLSIWDFSGHPNYQMSHYFFLQQPSLVLLVFNMKTYDSNCFNETIGQWLDWIVTKTNKLVILPVGTHADKLPKSKIRTVCEQVSKKLQEYVQKHKESLQKEIKRIEGQAHISPSLSEQLKLFINLLKMDCTIHEEVLPVSSADLQGTEHLLKVIETMALKKDLFPQVMRVIPSLWVDVEAHVEDKGDNLEIPLMTWTEYSEMITKKFGMKHLLEQITQYLHDIGKVLWFADHPTLKDFVFLRPSWVTDLMKGFFRHDMELLDYSQDDSIKQSSVTYFKFEKLRKEYLETGIVDKDLLKCLWSSLVPRDLNKPVMEVLAMLVEHMGIGYPVKKGKDSQVPDFKRKLERKSSSSSIRSVRSVADTEKSLTGAEEKVEPPKDSKSEDSSKNNLPKISRAVIPWCLPRNAPAEFRPEYEQFVHNRCLSPVFRFPKHVPAGFFESMTIRAMRPDHQLMPLYHWRNGLYGRHAEQPVRFYFQRISHDDGSSCLRVECRHEEAAADEGQLAALWKLMLPLLRDIDELAASFKGARVLRMMECPFCRSLSFLGEWLTPKEFQALEHKTCDVCRKDVPTAYLVQPKEKRRIEEFLRMRMLKKAELERKEKELLETTSTADKTDTIKGDKEESESEMKKSSEKSRKKRKESVSSSLSATPEPVAEPAKNKRPDNAQRSISKTSLESVESGNKNQRPDSAQRNNSKTSLESIESGNRSRKGSESDTSVGKGRRSSSSEISTVHITDSRTKKSPDIEANTKDGFIKEAKGVEKVAVTTGTKRPSLKRSGSRSQISIDDTAALSNNPYKAGLRRGSGENNPPR